MPVYYSLYLSPESRDCPNFPQISPACIIPTCSNLWLMQLEGLAPVVHAGLSQLPAVFPAVTRLFLVVIQLFLEVTGVTRLQNDQYIWMLQLPPGEILS